MHTQCTVPNNHGVRLPPCTYISSSASVAYCCGCEKKDEETREKEMEESSSGGGNVLIPPAFILFPLFSWANDDVALLSAIRPVFGVPTVQQTVTDSSRVYI